MKEIQLLGFSVSAWVIAPLVYLLWVSIGWTFKKALFVWLERIAKRTSTEVDDIVIDALNRPVFILIFLSGLTFVWDMFIPPALSVKFSKYVLLAFKAGAILAVVLFVNKLFLGLVRAYSVRIELLRISSGFTEVLVQAVVLGIGVLILLDSFGVSITPILASLGLGSLAVALALQPTLENLVSGIQIILDRPIVPGHFVKLESGEEGYVEKVGWRSTWIRLLPNNMVIVPNKQIINSKVLNYYYPSKDMAVLVQVGVHYSSDLEKVERITCEVAAEIMKTVQGSVADFQPFIRFHTFDSSSINFTVIMKCKEFVDNYLIKHEFVKALSKRYTKEGIVIPFPIMAINTQQEKAMPKIAHN